MRLDMDLVRQLLIYFEEKEDVGSRSFRDIRIPDYSDFQVGYHLIRMYEAGFITGETLVSTTTPERIIEVLPFDLTWQGHQFLEAIRDEGIWRRAKDLALSHTGGLAFEVITSIVLELSKRAFGFNQS